MLPVRSRALLASLRLRAPPKPGAGKKGGKGADATKKVVTSNVSVEVRSKTVVGANILKDGSDPEVKPDSEYPDWLWKLVEPEAPLSELQREDPYKMPDERLRRFLKLENRQQIKEVNSSRAKI